MTTRGPILTADQATMDAEAQAAAALPAPTRTSNLASALARVQARLPYVHKGKTAKVPGKDGKQGYSYTYADLSDIAAILHPVLAAHDLAWTAAPTLLASGFVLAYQLMHAPSGEAIQGHYPLGDPRSMTPQQIGSAITYARRYCLCSVTGIVPDEDDDGTDATTAGPVGRGEEPVVPTVPAEADRPREALAYIARMRGTVSPAATTALKREAGLRELLTEDVMLGEEQVTLEEAFTRREKWLKAQREGQQG